MGTEDAMRSKSVTAIPTSRPEDDTSEWGAGRGRGRGRGREGEAKEKGGEGLPSLMKSDHEASSSFTPSVGKLSDKVTEGTKGC